MGFGADGASVNMGKKGGVQKLLKDKAPLMTAVHCVAHRLELGVVNALKEQPLLTELQSILQMAYRQYHVSPKSLRELRAIAEAMEEKVLKPTNILGTRWVPYVHKAAKVKSSKTDV